MGFEIKDLDPQEQQIRQDMDDTRSALTEKLESLEQKVSKTVEGVTDTVANVTDAVQGTVDTVKDSVQNTVEAVQDTLNLPLQVERRPWLMVGGSVVAGFLLGRIFSRGDGASRRPHPSAPDVSSIAPVRNSPDRNIDTISQPSSSEPSWLEKATEQYSPEIAKLKSLAIGTLCGLVRDMVRPAVPESVAPKVVEVIDSFTTKMGGAPIAGAVISRF